MPFDGIASDALMRRSGCLHQSAISQACSRSALKMLKQQK
jgi:hypothetical protein